jgi:O-antigen/teichoic acid export membrane protein
MPEQHRPNRHAAPAAPPSLLRSVSANWLWCGVVAVSGFVLPRLIDIQQGQSLLGVWDFGWSLVVYINFLAVGVASAINRYVARFRTEANWPALNEHVNASLCWLCVACAGGLILAGVFAWLIPHMLEGLSSDTLRTARLVVLLLATKCALQVPMGAFNGIITGYERFDWLNAVRIVRDIASLLVMAVLLVGGHGLVALAVTLFIAELLGDLVKVVLARRLCPALRLGPRYASLAALRAVLGFGAKTIVQSIARGGVYQGSSLLVGIYLGPAALAIFARQRSLVMHLTRFTQQYAQVFVPRSSAIQAVGDQQALRQLLVQTSRYGLYASLPPILILLLLGTPLMQVWMGSDYRSPEVLAAMVVGHLLFLPQMGVYSILMGLGRHGIPAVLELLAAGISLTLGILMLGFWGGGLFAAAIAMCLPMAVASGVVLPLYACRLVGLSFAEYFRHTVPLPLLANLPLVVVLLLAREILAADPVSLLWLGGSLGAVVSVAVYFAFVLPPRYRKRFSDQIRRWPWLSSGREEVPKDAA